MLNRPLSHFAGDPSRRAVIDIGTNSIKLLVADITANDVVPVCEESKQTRLGQGFYETHILQADAIAATAEAVQNFFVQAQALGVPNVRVIATSAARDARNGNELVEAIQKKSSVEVEIISGEQEADWVFQGVTSDPKLKGKPLLIMDVGGGSTEFILGHGNQQYFRNSYRLGTVRLLEQLRLKDPPGAAALAQCRRWLRDFLVEQIAPALGAVLERCDEPIQLVGTGGTTSIMARVEKRLIDFDRDAIEGTRLPLDRLNGHMEQQWNLTLEERKKIIGLPPKRADVILTGMAIFESVMEQFGFAELLVSTRGLRFAAIHPKS